MSAWVLPDHIADILPLEARHIEGLRRGLLDTAATFGYELVIPPLMEHLDSLLTGSGQALDLQTFKTVDQLSGRTVGMRADSTQQVARIDAHLLNRQGVTRLCYCGPVLHTRPERPYASREPLQFGAEIYGCQGLEADLEAIELAQACLARAGVAAPVTVVGDVRLTRRLLAGVLADFDTLQAVHVALAAKDASSLRALTAPFPDAVRQALQALPHLYGDRTVLAEARSVLAAFPQALGVLDELEWLADRLGSTNANVNVSFDLADLRGYAYYSGMRFSIYSPRCTDALVRGGRYDEVGAAYGRNRPAAGFSLDVKQLATAAARVGLRSAVLAPWSEDGALKALVHQMRSEGETVIYAMPGNASEAEALNCDRELVLIGGQWQVRALGPGCGGADG